MAGDWTQIYVHENIFISNFLDCLVFGVKFALKPGIRFLIGWWGGRERFLVVVGGGGALMQI